MTLVANVRGHGSILGGFTADHPRASVDGVLLREADRAIAILLVHGARPMEVDDLLARVRKTHGPVEVLFRQEGEVVVRVGIQPQAISSGALRALFSFASRFERPYLHAARGDLEVRAGVPHVVAHIEAALMRAYLHRRGLPADVHVDAAQHSVPSGLRLWCDIVPAVAG